MAVRLNTTAVTVALALAGVVAVMAYTQAAVSGSATVAVVTTEQALLALSCSDGPVNADGACYIEHGQLYLDFSKGIGESGFQPNSTYEFTDLVIVKNNSAGDITLSFAADGELFATEGLTVDVAVNPPVPATLSEGDTATISFKFSVEAGVEMNGLDGTLQLMATRGGAGE